MGLIVASLIINLLIALFGFNDGSDSGLPTISKIMLVFWAMSLFGSILYYQFRNKVMGAIAFIGFIAYVPIGLIGVRGLLKLTDRQQETA